MSERKEKFTPGPWKVWDNRDKETTEHDYAVGDKDGWLVAEIGNDSIDIEEANASLIAAAPEMYENERVNVALLKSYLKLFEDFSRKAGELFCDAYFTSVVDILRERIWKTEQLLAKARGEA